MSISIQLRPPSKKEIDDIYITIKEQYPITLWCIFGGILVFMLSTMVIKNACTSNENLIPSIVVALAVLIIFFIVFLITRLKINILLHNVKDGRIGIAEGNCINIVKKAVADMEQRGKTVYYYYISVQNETIKISDKWLLGERVKNIGDSVKVIFIDNKPKFIWNKI